MGEREPPDPGGFATAKSLLWNIIAVLVGWTSFLYWWSVVLRHTERQVVWHLVAGLALVASFLVVFSLLWVLHNHRLGQRSRRNRATPYLPGSIERDRLDREVIMDDLHILREASVVVVDATIDQKMYREGGAEDAIV